MLIGLIFVDFYTSSFYNQAKVIYGKLSFLF